MKRTKLKRKSKSPLAKLIKKLVTVSHTHVRLRDSIRPSVIGGYCFDCGEYSSGQQFQAGHWIPDAAGGALLRFHPRNMHGQQGGCNMAYVQERVKIDYTFKMVERYGEEYVQHLRNLRNKTIQADTLFYQTLIDLYEQGDEDKIVEYLDNYA